MWTITYIRVRELSITAKNRNNNRKPSDPVDQSHVSSSRSVLCVYSHDSNGPESAFAAAEFADERQVLGRGTPVWLCGKINCRTGAAEKRSPVSHAFARNERPPTAMNNHNQRSFLTVHNGRAVSEPVDFNATKCGAPGRLRFTSVRLSSHTWVITMIIYDLRCYAAAAVSSGTVYRANVVFTINVSWDYLPLSSRAHKRRPNVWRARRFIAERRPLHSAAPRTIRIRTRATRIERPETRKQAAMYQRV